MTLVRFDDRSMITSYSVLSTYSVDTLLVQQCLTPSYHLHFPTFIHEGVLAVLKKHKWSVGALCELYPEGQVGVSDVCVMGLNQNSGQKILLRLRTDDLQGEMMS
jgi:hypothetical protein